MSMLPWYPRDFASATRGWPLVARAVYRELLDAQWDLGSLQDDPKQLRELAHCTIGEWRLAWRYLEAKFPVFLNESDHKSGKKFRRNPRLEQHRNRALELSEKRSRAAKSRWEGDASAHASADAIAPVLHLHPSPSPSPSPSPKNAPSERREDAPQSHSKTNGERTPKERLWSTGLMCLLELGAVEDKARPMIGKWLADGHKPETVMHAIEQARNAGSGDPVPYVSKVLANTVTRADAERAWSIAIELSKDSSTAFDNADARTNEAVRKLGGWQRLGSVRAGYDTDQLGKQFCEVYR
jgi:hypothetical protein